MRRQFLPRPNAESEEAHRELADLHEAYLILMARQRKIVRVAAKAMCDALAPWTPIEEDLEAIKASQVELLAEIAAIDEQSRLRVQPHVDRIIQEQNALLEEVEALRGGSNAAD